MFVAVRTAASPVGMIGEVRHRLQAMDKNLPLYNLQSLDYYVDRTLTQPRYNTLLMSSFALLALILTMVGLYGSISYSVARRTHEIGIRMTLGAQRRDIMRAVIRDGMLVGAVGLAIGIPVAVAATRLIRSLLYGVSSSDPATFIAASLILLIVSLLASFIPAFRAAKIDPMQAVRTE
jgi:ABC-type antimicrobial peptide transport system permease subunit